MHACMQAHAFMCAMYTVICSIRFDPFERRIDLCNESCLSGWPAILCGKNFNIGYCMQTVRPKFFTASMLVGAIDFCDFDLI